MKARLLLVCILASSVEYTVAQKWSFEAIAIPKTSWISGDFTPPMHNSTEDNPITFSLEAGAAIHYSISPKSSISLGVLYSQQGQEYDTYIYTAAQSAPPGFTSKFTQTAEKTTSLNYLKIPIQYMHVQPDRNIAFTWVAGLYVAYLLNATDRYVYTHHVENTDLSNGSVSGYDITAEHITKNRAFESTLTDQQGTRQKTFELLQDPFHAFDLGGIFGAGLQFKLSDKLFMPLLLKYQLGFLNIKNMDCKYIFEYGSTSTPITYWQLESNYTDLNENYFNASFGLSVGLIFR